MTQLTREQILVLVIEEAGELIQAATKALRFGYKSTYDFETKAGANNLDIWREFGELAGVMFQGLNPNGKEIGEYTEAHKDKMHRAEILHLQYMRTMREK